MTRGVTHDGATYDHKRKADIFEWETSKENVVPLKRGRNVADLNKALRDHDSFQTKVRLDDELKEREEAVMAYDGDDPLAAWLEYVRWLEVKMPEDTRKKFSVLEKCTRELKDNLRYKNDMRYIRLWIQYADLVSNPKDIFKYLYQNKIGERVSLFYIGWAYVLETMANYPQAHKIYLKASQKNAVPQDLLERKYKEFQRRMSRQWLRMTEEIGVSGMNEVTHRHALESLSAYGMLELNDAQREQLHQHRASTRFQRVQKANAHKPVFMVYEDTVTLSVDPLDGNGNWKKLATMQQQDKENLLAPSTWNSSRPRQESGPEAGLQSDYRPPPTNRPDVSPLQVFVDDEFFESEPKRRTPLTHRYHTLRQRTDGVATEEEMLAQEPLKNFTASDKKAHQAMQDIAVKSSYDVQQTTSMTGEAISFEEIRARAYQQIVERRRKVEHRALRNVTRDVESASNVILSTSPDTSSGTASAIPYTDKPALRMQATPSLTSRCNIAPVVTKAPNERAPAPNEDQEDMTINTRVALEDINKMFCSPPRQPKPSVWDANEDAPVERMLHFSVFDDSVDSLSANQVERQDTNESVAKQTQIISDGILAERSAVNKNSFQVFRDDAPKEPRKEKKQEFQVYKDDLPDHPRPGKKTWSEKRKPLVSRDDLVRNVRLTNKDALIQAQKDAAAKER